MTTQSNLVDKSIWKGVGPSCDPKEEHELERILEIYGMRERERERERERDCFIYYKAKQ